MSFELSKQHKCNVCVQRKKWWTIKKHTLMCHRFASFDVESFDIESFLPLLIGDEILLKLEFLQWLIVFL